MSSGGGMRSLYADLLESEKKSTESSTDTSQPQTSALADQDDAMKRGAQQINAAALRFQPLRRPGQQPTQKPKIKTGLAKLASATTITTTAGGGASSMVSAADPASVAPATRFSLEDWAGDDDEASFAMEKRQRGGRKKRRKNREEHIPTNWDEIYHPSRPTNLEEWWHSDARLVVEREWKDRLYAHRMVRKDSSDLESSDDEDMNKNSKFAPPPGLNFAPPPTMNINSKKSPTRTPSPYEPPSPQNPSPESSALPDVATGDDAFARRMRMSHNFAPPESYTSPQPPPPPPPAPISTVTQQEQVYNSATISRAPVRYELPPAPSELPTTEAELEETLAREKDAEGATQDDPDAPRSLRPGQKGFAERMLAKYGWTEGTGLGATGSGIVKPLQVKVEKAKKRPDSEGGGFVGPTNKAKIIGGKRGGQAEEGKFGAMSDVVVLIGMVDGMDVEEEMAGANGGPGLMQEIGEECESKYGRVERVYIDRGTSRSSIPVFVKFTSQLSALRAVNALEGRIFNGNKITARFYDSDKFEQGVYQ